MRRAAVMTLFMASQALAHEGHGAPAVHLHWWEYALLAAAVAAAIAWLARR
jgi:Flp pilus assembly pilin Flp